MTPEQLRARTKLFAVATVRFCRSLTLDPFGQHMALQLARAATSVAANYRAVCRARSRADFINKLGVVIEEADESALWFEVMSESDIVSGSRATELRTEADELPRIFVRSRETAQANRSRALGSR